MKANYSFGKRKCELMLGGTSNGFSLPDLIIFG
jgi:hypothetical protein